MLLQNSGQIRNVAYVKKADGEIVDEHQMVVVELNGKLYFGDYTSNKKSRSK